MGAEADAVDVVVVAAAVVVVADVVDVAVVLVRPRATAVATSTVPDAVSWRDRWKSPIAVAVAGPKRPSAPPRTVTPARINASCKRVTAGPD